MGWPKGKSRVGIVIVQPDGPSYTALPEKPTDYSRDPWVRELRFPSDVMLVEYPPLTDKEKRPRKTASKHSWTQPLMPPLPRDFDVAVTDEPLSTEGGAKDEVQPEVTD